MATERTSSCHTDDRQMPLREPKRLLLLFLYGRKVELDHRVRCDFLLFFTAPCPCSEFGKVREIDVFQKFAQVPTLRLERRVVRGCIILFRWRRRPVVCDCLWFSQVLVCRAQKWRHVQHVFVVINDLAPLFANTRTPGCC